MRLYLLYATESEVIWVIQYCSAGASIYVINMQCSLCIFIVICIKKSHQNAGNKAIEFCHIIGWYELLVTSDIDALYISWSSSVIRDLPAGCQAKMITAKRAELTRSPRATMALENKLARCCIFLTSSALPATARACWTNMSTRQRHELKASTLTNLI